MAPPVTATTAAGAGGDAGHSSSEADQQAQQPTLDPAAAGQIAPPVQADGSSAPVDAAARPVTLRELPQALQATIDLAVRQGSSVARLQLAPVTLGSIQIQLEHTSEGLIAHVVAERPDAAATLQQAGGELRKALESSGTTLLRLDIQTGSDQRNLASRQGGDPGTTGTTRTTPAGAAVEESGTRAPAAVRSALPGAGALVDIFA